MAETKDGLFAGFEYNTDLFKRTTIQRLARHFKNLMENMVANPDGGLADLDLLDSSERDQLLRTWAGTSEDLPRGVTLVHLFQAQVERSPHGTAISHQGHHLSFELLNRRANGVARRLMAYGIGPEDPVAICVKRSLSMAVGLLGILKAGAAYVPMDPDMPEQRLQFMLRDSGARLLMVDPQNEETFKGTEVPVIALTNRAPDGSGQAGDNPPIRCDADDLFYVAYTSGSTGRPKGILVPQRLLLIRFFWMWRHFPFASGERCCQKTTLSFVDSAWEIFGPLIKGIPLVMVSEADAGNIRQFISLLAREAVSRLTVVPSLLRSMLGEHQPLSGRLSKLKLLVTSGESLPMDLYLAFRKGMPACRLLNLYGASEVSPDVTACEPSALNLQSQVPIGKPITNASVSIVNRRLQPTPTGVPGELCIGGRVVSRGYVGRSGQTAERYVADPFGASGARLFRTGDRARFLEDGQIEYLGRLDQQVKLRGLRIEPGEIETVLMAHSEVQAAVVVLRQDANREAHLIAYVQIGNPGSDGEVEGPDLTSFLRRHLPLYMIPAVIVPLESLPLTVNGKIDRKRLPAPPEPRGVTEAGLPRNELEVWLKRVWETILKVNGMGIHDDFFNRGGHSLLAYQVLARIRQRYQVAFPLRALFENPTIAQLAERIQAEIGQGGGSLAPPIEPMPRDANIPMSFAQQRLWLLEGIGVDPGTYTLGTSLGLGGRFHTQAFQASLEKLVDRHESLRTQFGEHQGRPVQRIMAPQSISLEVVDLQGLPPLVGNAVLGKLSNAYRYLPFNLAKAPLFRVTLIKLNPEDQVVLLAMHHLISDGWSLGNMVSELGYLYSEYSVGREPKLSPLTIQYADYSSWQRHWLRGTVLKRLGDFWKRHLRGAGDLLELPTDRPRPLVQTYRGKGHRDFLDPVLTNKLRELGRGLGTTLFTTMQAAFATLLSRYSGQTDLLLGTPVANRTHREIEPLIGFFANTLVLRHNLAGNPGFHQFLEQVRQQNLDAFANQEMPFEHLVEILQPKRQLSYSPLFQVFFSLQKSPLEALSLPGLEISRLPQEQRTAMWDLHLSLTDVGSGLEGLWEFNCDLFDDPTIEAMAGHFRVLLESIVADSQCPLFQLPMMDSSERNRLLEAWGQTHGEPLSNLQPVHQWFEMQAETSASAVAVLWEDHHVTYGHLNARAHSIACRLRDLGAGPETPLAVCLARTPEMVASVLAIQKVGAAYVPLDGAYPPQRLRDTVKDCGAPLVLTENAFLERFTPSEATPILVDGPIGEPVSARGQASFCEVSPSNLSHIIYTSGSTGKPKGVAISRRSTSALIDWVNSVFSETDLSGMLGSTSLSFDLSVFEIFGTLCWGGTLVLVDQVLAVGGLPSRQRVSLINTVPSAMAELLRSGAIPSSVSVVNLAGEVLPGKLVQALYQKDHVKRVYNLYGPTEDTTYSTYELLAPGEGKPTIGSPLKGTSAAVLDPFLNPVPVGVFGTLYLAGNGLARAYHGLPALTASQFIPNPFATNPGARLYRTGDLVRLLRRGTMAFLGREDHQVKLRGFRIELGEIEAVLVSIAGVREAVMRVCHQNGGPDNLVAYLTVETSPVAPLEFERLLSEKLPSFMIPSQIVVLDQVPRHTSGKVNRSALPVPSRRGDSATASRLPRNATEEFLASCWAEVLHVKSVGIDDNFFELGGHSLLAYRVVSRLRDRFQQEFPLRVLFEHPTIARLAQQIGEKTSATGQNEAYPIAVREKDVEVPLSFAQQRLWLLESIGVDPGTYNLGTALRLRGPLDFLALEKSFQRLLLRHESLRTSFAEKEGRPVQVLPPSMGFQLGVLDWRRFGSEAQDQMTRNAAGNHFTRRFCLERGPLLQATLLKLSATDQVLLLVMHHMIADGWSLGLMVRELASHYGVYVKGVSPEEAPLEIQYADFALWQRRRLRGALFEEMAAYWREQLAGAPSLLELPTDRPRPSVQTYSGSGLAASLGEPLSQRARALALQSGTTLFVTLQAAFAVLLSRYSGQRDVLLGTQVANRTHRKIEPLIGFFANTLVLRHNLLGNPGFSDFLGQVSEVDLQAHTHGEMPFEALVELLQPKRDMSYSPLFQVHFSLQKNVLENLKLPGLAAAVLEHDHHRAKWDLNLTVTEHGGDLECWWEFNSDLFDQSTIARMAGHFRNLLDGIVADPHCLIGELPLMDQEEHHQMLVSWNQTHSSFPAKRGAHGYFEIQAKHKPEAVAVVQGHRFVTFETLDVRAQGVAEALRERGAGPDIPLGLCLERTPDMVLGLLAILKSGSAYVPMDAAYPKERLSYMLHDVGAPLVVTQTSLLDRIPPGPVEPFLLDGAEPEPVNKNRGTAAIQSGNACLSHVIYTSGSTGKPKGVAIRHRSTTALLHWMGKLFSSSDLDGVLGATSICFDLSVFEILGTLSWGGKVVLVDQVLDLATTPARSAVRLINTVPSAMTELLRDNGLPGSVRVVNLAGEALPATLVKRLYAMASVERVYNLYGPSEDTTYSTFALVDPLDLQPPIGKPLSNTRAYVLDELMQPVPMGVMGTLYLGGHGLARGYHRRPGLTATQFIPNPLGARVGGRLYHTGDAARYLRDGSLVFLGRRDHQVKLRGFRIELGEIEAAILAVPAVGEVCVTVGEDPSGYGAIVAYLVFSGQHLTPSSMKTVLAEQLPAFMMPAQFVVLDGLPRTANGKIDRNALPLPETLAAPQTPSMAPRNPTEALLHTLWCELLGRSAIGLDENFFDMGGHSLVAHQMLSRVRQTFALTLPLKTIFESPTLSAFSQRIDNARLGPQKRPLPPMEPVSRNGPIPMSFAQQRMWLLQRLGTDAGTYNLCVALQMKGLLEPQALQDSLQALRQRHESLRTRFAVSEGQPVQIIGDLDVTPVPVVDLCSLPKSQIQLRARLLAEENQIQPFDLEKGPLLRLTLLKLGPADHLLLLGMHHIITDGWSVGILIREMSVFYRAFALAKGPQVSPLAIQYADYSQWQRQWLQGDLLARLEAFWKNRLAGAAEFLDLPTDRPRPAVQTFAGNTLVDRVDATAAEGLRRLGRQCGTTLFMTLQATFATLLSRYSGQRDVVLGTPVANRGHEALAPVIGFFVNTLVLRHACFGDSTFVGFLKQVRKLDLEAFDHGEMPFEHLVEVVQPTRNLSYSPLFQVQISLNNAFHETPELVGLKLTELPVASPRAKWDLHLSVTEEGSELRLDWEYNTDLFDQSRMVRMTGHFQNLLRGVVSDPHLTLSKVPLLSDGERRQIVEDWNQTQRPLPRCAGVLPQFEAQVAKNPDGIAVTWGTQQISFALLNHGANRFSAHLRALGMGPETSVGICMDRSVAMIEALLAILKCGAAYVPLDPSLPFKRLNFMAADSDTRLILAARNYAELLEPLQVPLVFPDQVPAKSADWSGGNLGIEVGLDQCAYILYTSGSTGQPKGVMVSHGGLANYLQWCLSAYAVAHGGGSPLHGSLGFDATLTALWPPLLTGSGLWIVPEEGELTCLAAALTKRPFDLVKLTPAHLNLLAEEISRYPQAPLVKTLVIGGEALFAEDLAFWRKLAPQTRLINEYGPTETVVGCCVGEVAAQPAGQISIGSPIINTQIYLLDPVLSPVPVGVTGELFIGGMGLGRGYRGRPGLTARCFVPNPFATPASVGSRLYGSGDLARYDSHGTICFHGRRDHQVKIRGYRIELGEIETLIHAHGQVEQAAVLVCSGPVGDNFLAAFLRLSDPEAFSAKDLRKDLGRQLPDYMVPRVIHCLDNMPMTVNGKIDRQALAGMDLDHRQEHGESVAPRNQTETFLCACWSRLLQLEQVGVEDNFFQLGGHSLLAHQVLSRVRETLTVELPLKTLFECPTIRQLANRIIQAQGMTVVCPSRPSNRFQEKVICPFPLPNNGSGFSSKCKWIGAPTMSTGRFGRPGLSTRRHLNRVFISCLSATKACEPPLASEMVNRCK